MEPPSPQTRQIRIALPSMLPAIEQINTQLVGSRTAYLRTAALALGAGHRASRPASWRRRRHTQMTDFHTPLTCINLASPAAVASGGVQPIPVKSEGSATSEPDSRS